ncbi:uncharacterized protein Tco025E_07443 [Trypanosoma conorhini]|uniref:Uncharacterized protein n=1 Tax=Trypanosoma conorhini TaxID=83891 RepID=A0A3R7NSM0_9TRYP|nr:uncharacterized protein Tco025E_07443 [Trypanosoma conorhini]RNF07058.1 hypothetical protein Tco025E_07443 [Trypanosoma conorhini]
MSSGATPRAQRTAAPVSSLACVGRNAGDWRSTLKVFVEEVTRLKGETDALKATRAAMEASWQQTVEKVSLLTDENRSSQQILWSLLEEERQRALAVATEREELLARVRCVEEASACKEKEMQRLAEMLETEKIKHSVCVALHEKAMEEKEAEHRTELSLREKRLEEMQLELRQQLERHARELLAKDTLLDEERRRRRKRYESADKEDVSHLLHVKGATPSSRLSSESTTGVADLSCNTASMTRVGSVVVADDGATRSGPKKSRLEAARQQQRRRNGSCKEDVTLLSLNKLNDLQENFRL